MEMDGMMVRMLICGLLGVALLAVATLAIVWLARHMKGADGVHPGPESPEEILKRRYASGGSRRTST